MSILTVELGARSYPIHIGAGLLQVGGPLTDLVHGRDVMIVSNETVAPLYLRSVEASLHEARRVHNVVLPDGESYKTLEVMNRIFTALLSERFGRDALLVALGGGVVGDMVGFAAASYQRGVDFVQIPTTLLAQVDSSVGGKTAVNHELGKNMIGAFHQPIAVIADTETLTTLPDRELAAGFAEVIKYGLICDPEFFDWLSDNVNALLGRERTALERAIHRSCEVKADIVARDEREAGQRALLNLGHTFGHAIETGMGYGRWLHGEAVAAGMAMAAEMSNRLGWLSSADVERTDRLLQDMRLPTHSPNEMTPQRMLDLMMVDKKVSRGQLRLVLLEGIGHAVLSDSFDASCLEATLDERRKAA